MGFYRWRCAYVKLFLLLTGYIDHLSAPRSSLTDRMNASAVASCIEKAKTCFER